MWFVSDLHISHNYSTIGREKIEHIFSCLLSENPDRIIFNGDTFDFARTNLLPENYIAAGSERKYGLNSNPEGAALKMRLIAGSNGYFFDLLRRLIGRGFILHFIYGNHDSELRFDDVQDIIISETGAEKGKNIFFDMNFSDDLLLAEHGHQYDPENRILYEIGNCPEEYSFGYVTTKYFGNIIEKEAQLPRNDISAGEYFVWVFRNFGLKAFIFIFQYFLYASRVILRCGRINLSQKSNADKYLAPPIMSSLFLTVRRLYLIQVTLFLLFSSALIITLLLEPSVFFIPVIGLSVTLLPLFKISNRDRTHRLLSGAAKMLKKRSGRRYIVFGHNHFFSYKEPQMYYSSVPVNEPERLFVLRFKGGGFEYHQIPIRGGILCKT